MQTRKRWKLSATDIEMLAPIVCRGKATAEASAPQELGQHMTQRHRVLWLNWRLMSHLTLEAEQLNTVNLVIGFGTFVQGVHHDVERGVPWAHRGPPVCPGARATGHTRGPA